MSFQEDTATYIEAMTKERIQKGIEILDRKYGPDWVNHISLGVLDLSESNKCVLGQVYEGYVLQEDEWEDFFRILGEERGSPFNEEERAHYRAGYLEEDGYGIGRVALDEGVFLDPTAYGFESDGDADYEDLTEGWKEAIRERLEGRTTPNSSTIGG